MTRGFPTYCGYDRAGRGCTNLAVVRISTHGRSTLACTEHRADRVKWVSTAGTPTITAVEQPQDAVDGNGQGTLFDLEEGAA